MNDIISVIVPVYKVEPYLSKCIDSILAQTYAELEIILVDDGSPDNCPAICDEYAEKDSRIKVIHKQNGGLSSARNAGLDTAVGAWIGFVDSDDFIEPQMYQNMLTELKATQSDIAVCGMRFIYSSHIKEEDIGRNRLYSPQKALYEIIKAEKLRDFAYNKLYKKSLFDDIRFPEGQIFEDVRTTYKTLEKSLRIVHINQCLYNYLRRDDSIVGRWGVTSAGNYTAACYDRLEDLAARRASLKPIMLKKITDNMLHVKQLFCHDAPEVTGKDIKILKQVLRKRYMNCRKDILLNGFLSKRKDFLMVIFLHIPKLYRTAYRCLKNI